MPGTQHHLLVLQRRFLLLRLAQLEHALEAPAFKDRQAQLRANGKTAGTPVTEVRELQRLKAGAAGQANARVEVGLGHADAGRGGVQLRLGLTDVRAALGQFRRHAHGKALYRAR
ncbi:hypothetical protein D3C79_843360 [compost metagenome]